MKYLTKEIIVSINKKTVFEHGGNFIHPLEECQDWFKENIVKKYL